MIDPNNIINYNRTGEELEELILFLVCVAGKKASTVARQLNQFLTGYHKYDSPFRAIRVYGDPTMGDYLTRMLKICRFGQYAKIERAFRELANSGLDLRTCTKEDLMQIHGIGRKSASCFLAWTREGEKVAMLDTHLLAELRDLGYNAPKSTPSSKKEYDRLENIWLEHCSNLNVDPTQYDLQVWVRRSNTPKTRQASSLV